MKIVGLQQKPKFQTDKFQSKYFHSKNFWTLLHRNLDHYLIFTLFLPISYLNVLHLFCRLCFILGLLGQKFLERIVGDNENDCYDGFSLEGKDVAISPSCYKMAEDTPTL